MTKYQSSEESSSYSNFDSEPSSLDRLTSQMGGVSLNRTDASSTTPEVAPHPYFSKFKKYDYNHEQTDFVNFGHLAVKFKWSVGSKQWKFQWAQCFPQSWKIMRKANGAAPRFLVEYYAVFALHHYTEHYLTFVAKTKLNGWSAGSKTWRREWLNVIGYPYVKTLITDEANAKIRTVHKMAVRHNATIEGGFVQTTAVPTRGLNPYFEAYRSADFEPDYTKSFSLDFASLAQVKKWKFESSQYKKEKQKAFDEEFSRWYEKPGDGQLLPILQTLCKEIDVEVGVSIKKCKKVGRPTPQTYVKMHRND